MTTILTYYSRKDIQKEIFKLAKNREIAVKFGEKGFGKRPDTIQYPNDVLELAKQGATSFHASEEHWSDPLKLEPGMTKKQLDSLRIGFDLILDIDCKYLEYSKIATNLIIEALKFHNIKNIGVKFSGATSFHIALPFSSFPKKLNDLEIRLLFPEAPRTIALYLKQMIYDPLKKQLLETITKEELSNLTKEKEFDPFSIIGIDTILISNRHMFRMPYSLNEKRNLVSIPIKPSQVLKFDPSVAKIQNVEIGINFLPKVTEPEATHLIIQAFDFLKKEKPKQFKTIKEDIPANAINSKFFPPCILNILKGIKLDGRKRALFILINFLKHAGYSAQEIEKILDEWNSKNYEPLKQGYIFSQLNWYKKQQNTHLPPNCDNESYYKNLAVCISDNLCKLIKNPVNYTKRKLRLTKPLKRSSKKILKFH